MILKEGTNVTLKVGKGLYFPREMLVDADAYQVVNNKTGVIEFEEVQLAGAWEAFQHFDKAIGEIWDEMEGNRPAPALEIVSAMPSDPDIQH
jgi:hypothetical protein